MRDQLFLGVDGGGTKTAAWLGSLARTAGSAADPTAPLQVIGRGTSGPSNPRAVGFELSFAHLQAAIASAFETAGLPSKPVTCACFCIAGAGRSSEQLPLTAWIESQGIAVHYRLAMDVEAVLAAGTTDCRTVNGIALIAGTGSIAWGRSTQGNLARCGGWGPLLGDEGSGYAIAMQGLQAACQAADGRCDPTALLPAFLEALNCAQAEQLVEWIYDPQTSREHIAGQSHVVFACARHEDARAMRIVKQAADELAVAVHTVALKLGFEPATFALALAGGVLCHQPQFVELVLQSLRQLGQQPNHWQRVEHPVAGALQLARQLAAESEA